VAGTASCSASFQTSSLPAKSQARALLAKLDGNPDIAAEDYDIVTLWYGLQTRKARTRASRPTADQSFSVLPAENSSGNWVKGGSAVRAKVEMLSGDDRCARA
jgi:hypothetical protein